MDRQRDKKLRVAIIEDAMGPLPAHPDVDLVKVSRDTEEKEAALTILRHRDMGHAIDGSQSALYVLLEAHDVLDDLWSNRRVIGFGRESEAATWKDLQNVLIEQVESQGRRDREPAVDDPPPTAPEGSQFISYFQGPTMRPFYQDLRDLLYDLEGPNSGVGFKDILPAQWLNLYGYYKSGAYLNEGQAKQQIEALAKAGKRKIPSGEAQRQKQIEADFAQIFYRDEFSTQSRKPILLTGETGTGKSVLAKMIHKHLEERSGTGDQAASLPYRQINCAALGNLLESELFGAMQGAFTDAQVTNPGAIISSYGGVLFLDEIASMPLASQARLLVYLDEGKVSPQGWHERPLQVPVRIVAAANEDLVDKIQQGAFRADLYHRFEQRLHIPPLRERESDDLRLLIHHLLDEEAQLSQPALNKLLNHDFRAITESCRASCVAPASEPPVRPRRVWV